MDLRRIQDEAWANKLAHGFNTTDVPADLKRLHGEVDEAIEAEEQGGEGFGSEIADCVIYTCGLSGIARRDLAADAERYAPDTAGAERGPATLADLHHAVDEAEAAWGQDGERFAAKLAAIVACASRIGEAAGLDVGAEVDRKLVIIAARRYERQPDGRLVKVGTDTDMEAG
jgi:NTP pyrophosphatase (non-canonical NTP hydrolase)